MSGLRELSQGKMGRRPVCPEGWAADWVAPSGSPQDGDASSDCSREDGPGSRLPRFVLQGKTHFPEMFQTGHLLFYERFSAYQDYILGEPPALSLSVPGAVRLGPSGPWTPWVRCRLACMCGLAHPLPGAASVPTVFPLCAADCKASEVREFTAEFLEKVLEPSGWRAVWHTNVFEVLVEVNFMPL